MLPPLNLKRPGAQPGDDDDVVIVTALPYERAADLHPLLLPVLPDLALLYGTFLSELGNLATSTPNVKDMNVLEVLPLLIPSVELASPIITRICAKLPAADLRHIRRELLSEATFNGKRLYGENSNPINLLLQGRTIDGYRILLYALEVNYPDFFGALGARAAKPPAASPSAT